MVFCHFQGRLREHEKGGTVGAALISLVFVSNFCVPICLFSCMGKRLRERLRGHPCQSHT